MPKCDPLHEGLRLGALHENSGQGAAYLQERKEEKRLRANLLLRTREGSCLLRTHASHDTTCIPPYRRGSYNSHSPCLLS